MISLLLLRLAPLLLAALLGTPRILSAAEIRTALQPAGVAPAIDLSVRALPARAAPGDHVRFDATPFAPAVASCVSQERVLVTLAAPEWRKYAAGSAASRQPPARAPPQLS